MDHRQPREPESATIANTRPSDRFAGRSMHGVPRFARALAEQPILRIDGLVATPRDLAPDDLRTLPRTSYLDAHSEGAMPATPWTGMRVLDIVALAGLLPEARFLTICGGPYCRPIALEDAESALLCDAIDGAALDPERGGPWRLAVPGDRYNYSVKWVSHIKATREPGDDSIARIAAARATARAAAARRHLGEP